MSEEPKKQKSEVKSWVICILCAAAAAILLRMFVFEIVNVSGQSMVPTLADGESLFVEKVSRYFGDVHRKDIVIIKYKSENEPYVKRVVGLPGDTVAVHDGALYVNGEKWDEPYINTDYIDYELDEETVPENCYFVLGDNRNESQDSADLGPVTRDELIGHALCIVWPIGRIGGIPTATK